MATQPPATETILVVDDDAEMLSFVGDALRMYGYTVRQTTDPREALRWARQHSGPIHPPLCDPAPGPHRRLAPTQGRPPAPHRHRPLRRRPHAPRHAAHGRGAEPSCPRPHH